MRYGQRGSYRYRGLHQMLPVVAALVCGQPALAQEARNPTRPPPGAVVQAADPAKPDSAAKLLEGTAVVMRDGKPYLASGTRLYAVGQQIGSSKIERITETEIWLRSGGQIQKIQRFEGIQRRAVQP